MPDTRYTLLGKLCVWAVRATDDQLRSALKKGGWKGLSITKRKSKRGGKKRKKATRTKEPGIYTAKNGREYEILTSGQARFI